MRRVAHCFDGLGLNDFRIDEMRRDAQVVALFVDDDNMSAARSFREIEQVCRYNGDMGAVAEAIEYAPRFIAMDDEGKCQCSLTM